MILTPFARRLCTIPWGKYKYCCLPTMGKIGLPTEIIQEKMSALIAGLEAYLDDLLIILAEEEVDKHLEKLEQEINCLSEAGVKVNAEKSLF
jgi:hypothetical protein